jgi:hypothetical protein
MMPQRALAVLLLVASLELTARALPSKGAVLPPIQVDDVSAGHLRPLPDHHPVLVMYEDRDAQKQNVHARDVLGKITDRPENRACFEFVAVADVAEWDWWPPRKYVLEDLRKTAKRENTALFADWKAALRKQWGAKAHKSVLLLAGADGKVLFSGEGTLSEAQLTALVQELALLGCRVQ